MGSNADKFKNDKLLYKQYKNAGTRYKANTFLLETISDTSEITV